LLLEAHGHKGPELQEEARQYRRERLLSYKKPIEARPDLVDHGVVLGRQPDGPGTQVGGLAHLKDL
jgi:hypothetical protein